MMKLTILLALVAVFASASLHEENEGSNVALDHELLKDLSGEEDVQKATGTKKATDCKFNCKIVACKQTCKTKTKHIQRGKFKVPFKVNECTFDKACQAANLKCTKTYAAQMEHCPDVAKKAIVIAAQAVFKAALVAMQKAQSALKAAKTMTTTVQQKVKSTAAAYKKTQEAYSAAQTEAKKAGVGEEELLEAQPTEAQKAAAKKKLDDAKKVRDAAKAAADKAAADLKKAQAAEKAKKAAVDKATKEAKAAESKMKTAGGAGAVKKAVAELKKAEVTAAPKSGAGAHGASLLGALLVATLVMQ